MTGCLSTCRSAPAATTWIVISCAWRRWSSPCALWRRRSATFRRARCRSTRRQGAPFRPRRWSTSPRWATSRPSQAIRAVTCPTLEGSGRDAASVHCHGRKACLPAAQRGYLRQHRRAHAAIQAGHVRPRRAAAEGRGLLSGGRGQRRARVLRGERRSRNAPIACGSVRPALRSCRPCPRLLVGDMIADMIPTFGSVNMIGGELDR